MTDSVSVSTTSDPTAAMVTGTADAPVNTGLPQITGSPNDGQTLSASFGSWSGVAPGFTVEWDRCDAAGDAGSCVPLSGVTNRVYRLSSADVGTTLRVVVTAKDHYGNAAVSARARSRLRSVIRRRR